MLSTAITDLSERVERIEAEVREGEAGNDDRLEARLENVETTLSAVRKAVAKLASKPTGEPQLHDLHKPWHLLTTAEAEPRWLELRAWVDWFVVRNSIGPKDIPNCWYLHSGLVDELEGLRWAWLETIKPTARGIDPIWWREALQRARARWPLFNVNGCGTRHSESRPRVMVGDDEWEDFLNGYLGRLPTAPSRAS